MIIGEAANLLTKDFRDKIVELCRYMSYPPFRGNGDGNLGYLFDLPSELAKFFLNEARKNNSKLNNISWIRDFLQS